MSADGTAPGVRAARRGRLLVSVLMALTSIAGCGRFGTSGEAPAEDVEFATRYLALFAARSFPAIEMGMDPAIRDPQIRPKIVQMAAVVPPGEPTSVHVVDSSVKRSGTTTTSSLSFQYQYPDRYLLADVVVERQGAAPVVKGVHIRVLRDSLESLNRVTFRGKGPAHYVALGVAVAVFLLVLYAFTVALRTPVRGPRWAWLLFIAVGIVPFAFNWTTGVLSIAMMGVQVLGSGFSKASSFAPLVIRTSIPVGAIIFLIQRREWLEEGETGAPDAPETDPGAGGS